MKQHGEREDLDQVENDVINTTATNCYYQSSNYCAERLPCGICKILRTECLKNYSITWTASNGTGTPCINPDTITC